MRVRLSLVCAVLCTAVLSSKAANADELTWSDSYNAAYKQAAAEKKELFLYFEPTTPSRENTAFVGTALKNADVRKLLETRVLLRMSTEAKRSADDTEAFSKNGYFKSPDLSKYGGWVVITFRENPLGSLKNSNAFQPPTPAGVTSWWDAGNILNTLGNPNAQRFSQAAATGAAGAGAGPGGEAQVAMNLINQYRQRSGLNALTYDPDLVFWDNSAHSNHYAKGLSAGAWGSGYGSGHAAVAGWQGSPAHNGQLLMNGITRHGVYFDGSTWVWAAK